MFDTIGTLVGTASRAGMVDKEGNMPNMKEALVSDSVATVVGAVTGTSTVNMANPIIGPPEITFSTVPFRPPAASRSS